MKEKVRERQRRRSPDGRMLVPCFRDRKVAYMNLGSHCSNYPANLHPKTSQIRRYKGGMRGKAGGAIRVIGPLEVIMKSARTRGAFARTPGIRLKREFSSSGEFYPPGTNLDPRL